MPPPPPPPPAALLLAAESMSSSGLSSDRLSLPALQSRMKLDPTGYAAELRLLRAHFASALHLFRARSALFPAAADPAASKDLADLAMFLSHMVPFYPTELAELPAELAELLRGEGQQLPSSLRCHVAQALILLVNRKLVSLEETLELFMELQVLGDRALRKLAFSHVVHSIRRMNQKHKDEAKNRKLQSILFFMLQGEDELRAKRSLIVLCDLHRRRVWFDDRTANAICNACFHTSSRIMIAALSFILGYEQVEEADDSEDSSAEDDTTSQQPQLVLNRETVYKAHRKGTTASKKKKQAKLQRVIRSMKRQQRLSSEKTSSNWYSPLTHLKDAQGFAEKLFSRLQKCNERFEVKMMMLKVISRTVGLHRLILLNLYPFLQKYVQPHQRDITDLLAAAIQACHDMVPPDAVEPLFKQIVNQFVHDRSRTEAIAVGLNVVREICLRIPLLMDEDLLQDLVLYKKSHEKAISTAARSLMTLFREICPSLLVKKDRGRPIDPKTRPKAFGEVSIASHVPGVELLHHEDDSSANSSVDEQRNSDTEDELNNSTLGSAEENDAVDDGGEEDDLISGEEGEGEGVKENGELEGGTTATGDDGHDGDSDDDMDDGVDGDDSNDDESNAEDADDSNDDESNAEDADDNEARAGNFRARRQLNESEGDDDISNDEGVGDDDHDKNDGKKSKALKRKFMDYAGRLNAADTSLRALKRLAVSKMAQSLSEETDGILSNEDFQHIKELKAKKEAKLALTQHGLLKKLPSSEQLSVKRVDPAQLEVNIKQKLTKEERLAFVRAGREDRGKYQARAAVKQKKTGGLSNRQKEHKKAMPLAAKKAKAARSRQEKRKQQRRGGGKQFRGKKSWK